MIVIMAQSILMHAAEAFEQLHTFPKYAFYPEPLIDPVIGNVVEELAGTGIGDVDADHHVHMPMMGRA